MFYATEIDRALRFGDVLQGYPSSTPIIEEPILVKSEAVYNVNVRFPQYTVVMDPCCEIRNKSISLTPLVDLPRPFFDNPYFAEDLTRINRKMEPQEAISPSIWERLAPEEKQKRLEVGRTYALLNLFVYEKHVLFPKYTLHRKDKEDVETNYCMIDFRNTYKLCCNKIITPEDSPLESKMLQLSIGTRSELREKLVNYYANAPAEDKGLED
jgi:hypothetical protein